MSSASSLNPASQVASPATPGGPSPITPLSSARLSCVSCRDRKQKCDRTLPFCRRCAALSHVCEYPDARKSSKGKRRQVHELEAKLLQLESQIQAIGSKNTSGQRIAIAPSTPAAVVSDGAAPRSYVQPSPSTINGGCPAPMLGEGTHHPSTDWLANSDLESICSQPVSPELRQELNAVYFEKSHYGAPMIHPSRYTSLLRSPPGLQPPPFLQHAVMALGAVADPSYASLVMPLYRRARTLAEADEMDDQHSAVTVAHAQGWLLLANLEAQTGHFSRASLSLGRSIRIAQILNLHQLDRDGQIHGLFQCHLAPPRDWVETEERRRTWWVLYVTDRLVFATTGLPAAIDDRHVHTLLPASEESFESSHEQPPTPTLHSALHSPFPLHPHSRLAARVLAAHLFHRAADLDPSSSSSTPESYWTAHQDLDASLTSLLGRLPPSLRLPANLACQHALLVNILLHTATLCLFKTALRHAGSSKPDPSADFARAQGRGRMLAAASQIAAVLRVAGGEGEVLRNPIVDYAAYLAGLVFLEDWAVTGSAGSKVAVAGLLGVLRAGEERGLVVAGMVAGQLGAEMERLGIATTCGEGGFGEVSVFCVSSFIRFSFVGEGSGGGC
ncbi:putative binuclear zinc transcription factor [Staphylotrichum tortipilum]|uniref:Binuclear zinc transcription factor n=1 Tax=Staphylotrichum tortipilum TaxID=2831512 RepID=A0AAN6MLT4_9PEZI|nr:putative binuclear zinc transcription factor [Staphylotrichum longicolle]